MSRTPGPWYAKGTPKDGWFINDRDDRLGHNVLYGLPEDTMKANARLAAAAPELLAELKEKLCGVDCACCFRARIAIEKAEGRAKASALDTSTDQDGGLYERGFGYEG